MAAADTHPCRDAVGQLLAIGDRVVTLLPNYRYRLAVGHVAKFTPKGVRVQLREEDAGYTSDGSVFVFPGQVAKVPQEGQQCMS